MLIDLHAHSSGISKCCRADLETVIETNIEAGFDGMVLTNHYFKGYLKEETAASFARRSIAEHEKAWAYGDRRGFRVFFGIEVTMEPHGGNHMLVYGVDYDFLMTYPELYDMDQKTLYETVHGAGGILVQAHPLRNNRDVRMDPAYLDGVEINCHKGYKDGTHLALLADYAAENGLILTCGCDYHADIIRPHGGTILPESIRNEQELAKYLYTTEQIELMVEEVDETEARLVRYRRGAGRI